MKTVFPNDFERTVDQVYNYKSVAFVSFGSVYVNTRTNLICVELIDVYSTANQSQTEKENIMKTYLYNFDPLEPHFIW